MNQNKADYIEDEIPLKNITPFKLFTLTKFPFIEETFDALNNYQLLCKIVEYLNKVIDCENNQNENINQLYSAFLALQLHVNTFFDTLDVQDEINNKLDELVENGILDSIINRYINNNIPRIYRNENELIEDIGLTEDMLVQTLGKININDGGGCIYRIDINKPEDLSNITNNNVDNYYLKLKNNLFAIPCNNINNDYYDEITSNYERINETDCYITEIPLKDNENKLIDLYVKNNSGMEISDYARKHKTTLSINATLAVINPETNLYENACVISNGEIIREHMNPPTFLNDNYRFIGIKENREFVDFQANITTAEQMIAQGVREGWLCFGKLVDNGVITDYANSEDEIMTSLYPRQAIGIRPDNTVIILTCDGRTVHDRGLTGVETAQILIEKGCINVYNLDGGGSTNTVYKGSRLNKYIDNHGLKERHIVYCLNAKKPTTNKNIDKAMSNIGIEKERIIKQLLPIIPRIIVKNPADLNELYKELMLYSCFNSKNYPTDANNYGYLLNIPIASEDNSMYGTCAKQFYFSRTDNRYWRRTLAYNVWSEWIQCETNFGGEITAVNNQMLGIGSNYIPIELNSNIANYYPNKLIIENNKIKSNIGCACKITATFIITCNMDGELVIRLKKNDTNIAYAQRSGEAGKTYQLVLNKMTTLGINDYIEFTSNGGINTNGVNKIISSNIIIEQNIT